MRKLILSLSLCTLTITAWGQLSKVRTAKEYLEENNYTKAIEVINEAVTNPETKNNADAWYFRGMAYLQMALDPAAASATANAEASSSFLKVLEINAAYGSQIDNPLYSAAVLAFNEGVAAYQTASFDNSYKAFMKVPKMYGVNDGTRYKSNAEFTKLASDARLNAAYAAIGGEQYTLAIPLLTELKNTVPRDSTIYFNLIDVYQKLNNQTQLLATINEARKYFPHNGDFRNQELNFYINTGRQAELLPKLESALKKEPHNAELWFNLGNLYEKLAYPKDMSNTPLPQPGNATEYITKAENAYSNALKEKPENPDYNYNLGVLFYEAASVLNHELTVITGTSTEENKKYDAILARRNAQFEKALPYFEKAYSTLDPKAASLDESMKITYKNVTTGLREIYSRLDNKAKSDEMKRKLEAMD